MTVTLKEIARLAQVDAGTVSHVLNNHPKAAKLRPETRRHIMQIVHQTGYIPNKLARAIKSGHSRVLALVSNNIGDDEFMGRIMAGALEVLAEKSYSLKVFSLLPDNHEQIAREICEQRIEGVLFHAPGHLFFEDIQQTLLKYRLPCATVDISNRIYGIGVTSADKEAMINLTDYAVGRGFVNLCGPLTVNGSWEFEIRRKDGFIAGVEKNRGKIKEVFDISKINNEKLPEKTAIICSSDQQALHILQHPFWKREYFPHRFGISGFGDGLMAGWGMLPLTSVNQSHKEMGQKAARELIKWIENPEDELFNTPVNFSINSRIIPRATM